MGSYTTDEDRAEFTTAVGDTEEVESETPEAPPEQEDTPDEGEPSTDEPVEPGEPGDEQPEDEDPTPAAGTDEPTFTVNVNGVPTEVPQSELIAGYHRQADYTRKVQMLAAQRRQLADANELLLAMERNPAETITTLARHFNVSLMDHSSDTYNGNGQSNGNGHEGPSPEQQRITELEQWQRAELSRQREAAVDAEVARLHSIYGEFDEDALYGFAVERQVPDLETALRAMTFQAPKPPRTEKRKVQGMAGGSGRSSGTATPKEPPESISEFRDAYAAAKRELSTG